MRQRWNRNATMAQHARVKSALSLMGDRVIRVIQRFARPVPVSKHWEAGRQTSRNIWVSRQPAEIDLTALTRRPDLMDPEVPGGR